MLLFPMFSQFLLPMTPIGKCLREIRLFASLVWAAFQANAKLSRRCFFGYENQDLSKEKEANQSAASMLTNIWMWDRIHGRGEWNGSELMKEVGHHTSISRKSWSRSASPQYIIERGAHMRWRYLIIPFDPDIHHRPQKSITSSS